MNYGFFEAPREFRVYKWQIHISNLVASIDSIGDFRFVFNLVVVRMRAEVETTLFAFDRLVLCSITLCVYNKIAFVCVWLNCIEQLTDPELRPM